MKNTFYTANKREFRLLQKPHLWLWGIFFLAFAARLVFALFWPIEPASDFAFTYTHAQALQGLPMAQWPEYFVQIPRFQTVWSVHTPFLLFQALLLKLFGCGIVTLKIFNAFWGSVTCLLAALLTKMLFGQKSGLLCGILLAVNPVCLFFTPVLTNQHIATMLFMGALYFFLCRPFFKVWINDLSAALLLALSQLMRPEMLVTLLAFICYIIWESYRKQNRIQNGFGRRTLAVCKRIAVIILTFTLCIQSVNVYLLSKNIVQEPITNTNLLYKIVIGLNYESLGHYTSADATLANDHAMLEQLLKERIQNKAILWDLLTKKTAFQFGTYSYSWSVDKMDNAFVQNIYQPLTQTYMLLLLAFALCTLFFTYKKHPPGLLLLLIILLGYFLTFALIEIQDRYNYFCIPLFTILASFSLVDLHRKIHSKGKKEA